MDATNEDNRTALYVAAGNGNAASAGLLLEGNSDPDTKDKLSMTALTIVSANVKTHRS